MPRFEVVVRKDFSDVTYLLEISHPLMAKAAKPGQFVIVMSHEHGERIPLTIADFDREKGTITLVVQAVGKTTRRRESKRIRRSWCRRSATQRSSSASKRSSISPEPISRPATV